jgi:hypothetical protein
MVIDLSRTTGVPRTPKLDTHMDDDDKTVLSSGKSNRIHPKTKKLCIKWTIQQTDTTTTKLDLMKEHLAVCKAIFDVSEHIIIINNKNEEHSDAATMALNLEGYEKDFKWKQRKGDFKRWILIHEIYTDVSLSTIKNHYKFAEATQASNRRVMIHHHNFAVAEWDIARFGFIHNVHSGHVPTEVAEDSIQLALQAENPKEKIPKFHLSPTFITMRGPGNRDRKTNAYEVQCLAKDIRSLSKMLENRNRINI